ncbi:MAG: three-Cys-motif partner protein TcmP [Thermoplasmata archaeon]|nr:three-Cys-motif partner protein TcmP [Thermoplasmata archaeon]
MGETAPIAKRAGPFFKGILDTSGIGSQARTRLERDLLLESERLFPASSFYRRVRPHSAEKLAAVRGYMWSYSAIMNKKHPKSFAFVDALAGPGVLDLREGLQKGQKVLEEDVLPGELALGSPLLALSNHPNYPELRLVEASLQPFKALSARVEAYYPGRTTVERGNCNLLLPWIAADLATRMDHALVLLDPEGLEVEFKAIREIRRALPKAEILVLYPSFMAVARCIVHRPSFSKLTRFFGDDINEGAPSWMDICELAHEGMLGSADERLLDEEPGVGADAPVHEALRAHYTKRLAQTGCTHIEVSPVVRSRAGRPLYHLILASTNATAARIGGDIFSSAHAARRG